ncbi:MAG: hypothetical protein AAFV86_01100 [Pseudomonadota bacterium]
MRGRSISTVTLSRPARRVAMIAGASAVSPAGRMSSVAGSQSLSGATETRL